MHLFPCRSTICGCVRSLFMTNACHFVNLFWENRRENFRLLLLPCAVSLTFVGKFLRQLLVNCISTLIFKTIKTIQARLFKILGKVVNFFFLPYLKRVNGLRYQLGSSFLSHKVAYPFERCVSFLYWSDIPRLRLVTWGQVANGFLFVWVTVNKMVMFNLKHLDMFKFSFI